jgi:hypothetical protein
MKPVSGLSSFSISFCFLDVAFRTYIIEKELVGYQIKVQTKVKVKLHISRTNLVSIVIDYVTVIYFI